MVPCLIVWSTLAAKSSCYLAVDIDITIDRDRGHELDLDIAIDTETTTISDEVSYYKNNRFPYHFHVSRLNCVVECFGCPELMPSGCGYRYNYRLR